MAREQPRVSSEPMGAGELSRAARSLESVQGNVAGQTMAIQSLSMSTQSAVINVGAQMNALGSQLAGLNSAISRMAGGIGMSSMPPPPPMMAMGGGGGFHMPSMAPVAGGMARAGMGVMSGLGTIGTGLGYMGGAMASPFMGNVPVTRTSYGAEMSGNASAYQAAVLGSGLGVGRGTMRNMNYDRATSAGRERFGDMAGNAALSIGAGAASLGTGLVGDFIGSRMIMPALGYSGSGLAGGLAGSLLGGAVMAPAAMALQQTMEQTSQIGKLGDQYGRNAFRMGGRSPSREGRSAFGKAGLDIAIQDMTLTSGDVSEITAGMFNNDLTRGVRGTSEASDRLRELSRSVKTMARTLGGSYGEMMQTAGELQSIGMNVNPQNTRQAVFGASSVQGMTGKEGMAAGMNLAQPFVGMGMGAQGFGIGLMSANAGQSAVQSGALGGNTLAAIGGREGAQALMSRSMANFLQGSGGMAMLAGGMTGGGGFGMGNVSGMGMQGILGRGGAMASGNNLLQLAMNPQGLMEEAGKNPTALMAQMASQAMDIGKQVAPKGASQQDIFKIGLQALTGAKGPELDALAKTIEAAPAANREMMERQARQASQAMKSDIMEQRSLSGQFGRATQRLTQPLAEEAKFLGDFWGNTAENLASGVEKSLYGTKSVYGMGKVGASDAKKLFEAMGKAEDGNGFIGKRALENRGKMDVIGRNYDKERASRPKLNKGGILAAQKALEEKLDESDVLRPKLASIKAKLADESDPREIQLLMREATELLGDMYTGSAKGAFEVALSKELGLSVSDGLAGVGRGQSVITHEMKVKNQDDLNALQRAITDSPLGGLGFGVGEDKIKSVLSSKEGQEFLRTGNLDIINRMDPQSKKILTGTRSMGEVGKRVVDMMKLEADETAFNTGASDLSARLSTAGLEDKAKGLAQGGASAANALAGMDLSPEEIAKLQEGGLSEMGAASLGLKAGKIDAAMSKTIQELMSPEDFKRILGKDDPNPNELTVDELKEIRGSAISAVMSGEVSVSSDGETNVTKNQAQLLLSATQKYSELAGYTARLGAIVDMIEARK